MRVLFKLAFYFIIYFTTKGGGLPMKIKRIIIMIMCVLVVGIVHPVRAEIGSGFSVTAIIPENQINPAVTFFDISLEPGEFQTLEVIIENRSNHEITVVQEVNSAFTNDNGVIDYVQIENFDQTLVHSFADIATFDNIIILPARSSQIIEIEINLPDEPFEGVILGGLHYQEKIDEDHVSVVEVENRFAFVIGLQISVGDVSQLEAQLQLNDIFPNQRNYRNVLSVNLQNTEAILIDELIIDAKVYMLDSDEPLREVIGQRLRMAPNSNFNFPISWEYQPFEDGKYILEMTAIADGREWNWREEFTIQGSEEFNEIAVLDEIQREINLVAIVAMAVFIGMGSGITLVILINKKK